MGSVKGSRLLTYLNNSNILRRRLRNVLNQHFAVSEAPGPVAVDSAVENQALLGYSSLASILSFRRLLHFFVGNSLGGFCESEAGGNAVKIEIRSVAEQFTSSA